MHDDLTTHLLAWIRSHFFGKYRGIVTDNADPTLRGRLKVRVPAILGELEIWAMPCVPYAGAGVGFYSLPEPETGVWIEFEAGDPSFPVWTGCFWATGELPDSGGADVKIWKTEKLTVRLDDSADELKMETTSRSTVTLAADISSESGGAKQTVGALGVVSELALGKLEVTPASVRINNGSMELM
jgi:uncharacterized protein involved in type VI secretion and phage assembly